MDITSLVKQLKEQKHLLGDRDESFAHSLIQFFETRGYLTGKQVPYVESLIARCNTAADAASREIEEVFDGSKLRSLFFATEQKLKYPKMVIRTENLGKVRFYRAGALSKVPGYIVIDNGKPFPNKKRYGSIDLGGHGKLVRTIATELKAIIRAVANAPEQQAKMNGIRFSNCCFCGTAIITKTSLYHGYGPVCAAKWGLPWQGPEPLEDIANEQTAIDLVDLGEGEQ